MMSEASEVRRTNRDDENSDPRETMSIGDAASLLGLSVPQVRKLCKAYERNPDEGLAFEWSRAWAVTHDVNGYPLRGHRMPYRDAVETLAKAKQHAERNPSA